MKFPISLWTLPMFALLLASLGGCNRDMDDMPARMENFNESPPGMLGEHNVDVHINFDYGVFNTIR